MKKYELGPITYITLWVKQYDSCVVFYRDQLGLPLAIADENFAQFSTSGTHLYLHRLNEGALLRNQTVEIHFEVPDVDEAYEALKAQGVKFESKPENMPWGTRMAACRDPEGFHIEIVGPLAQD